MRAGDWLDSAERLLVGEPAPSEVDLRRAVSCTYYAMFHCLARSCADLLVGGHSRAGSRDAWKRTYRALDHATARAGCRASIGHDALPHTLHEFSALFVKLQARRHEADYDPLAHFNRTDLEEDMVAARRSVSAFLACEAKDRRAFAAQVLFRQR